MKISKLIVIASSTLLVIATLPVQAADEPRPIVEATSGNIFLRSQTGEATQLTASGRDSTPVLSPDGRWIVFVRAVPGKKISTGLDFIDAAELWQMRASGKEPTRLVAPREAENMQNVIATFENIQFSSDGRWVFFVTPAWATSGAVHVVDTTNGKERFLMAGSELEVIHSGEYRDCLLVRQHRYFIGGGSYDWIWLFRPDGKEIGPIGEDATNFKELYCPEQKKSGNQREGAAPSDTPSVSAPPPTSSVARQANQPQPTQSLKVGDRLFQTVLPQKC